MTIEYYKSPFHAMEQEALADIVCDQADEKIREQGMSDREKFIEWYKTVPYFKQVDLCSCNGLFVETRVRLMFNAWQASRNAALDEAASRADDYFDRYSEAVGEVIYNSHIGMEIRKLKGEL